MSPLTLCRAAGKSTIGTIADTFDDTISMRASPPEVRRERVIRVRRQLARGTYDLDGRLDAVLERILTDITP